MSGRKTLRAVRVLADRLEGLRLELREERRAARMALLGRFDDAKTKVLARRVGKLLVEFLAGDRRDERPLRVAKRLLEQLGGES